MKRKTVYLLGLLLYFLVLYYFAVLRRGLFNSDEVRLDLFRGFLQPSNEGYKDLILNVTCFIPIGTLSGLLFDRNSLIKALLVGLLLSLTIECSQLIWHRGIFDVKDLFNNMLGSVMGSLIVTFLKKK